jgi:hypothetical protein
MNDQDTALTSAGKEPTKQIWGWRFKSCGIRFCVIGYFLMCLYRKRQAVKEESLNIQDEGTTILSKVRDHWPTNKVSHPRRHESTLTGLQKNSCLYTRCQKHIYGRYQKSNCKSIMFLTHKMTKVWESAQNLIMRQIALRNMHYKRPLGTGIFF